MVLDFELSRLALKLVLGGERCGVEVIDLTNRSKGNETDQDRDRVGQRAQEHDAADLTTNTTDGLHDADEEGIVWVGEVLLMVGHVFHHLQTLAHVTLHLQVHENGADKTSDEDVEVYRQQDFEAFRTSEDNHGEDGDQRDLDEEDLECSLEGIVHIVWVQLHLLH